MSHNRTDLSSEAEAIRRTSGLNFEQFTQLECPEEKWMNFLEEKFQILIVLSLEQERI